MAGRSFAGRPIKRLLRAFGVVVTYALPQLGQCVSGQVRSNSRIELAEKDRRELVAITVEAKATEDEARKDTVLESATKLVGKALFLRGFYLANELKFDGAGQVVGSAKVGDWTLAAVDVRTVTRRGPEEIELAGVRAAIRYNAEQHQFERHPLKDETIRIVMADYGRLKTFEAEEEAVFSVGIDPGLQAAMPEYWQHYFRPGLAWPKDELTGVIVYPMLALPNQQDDVSPPTLAHKTDARPTGYAERERVHGPLQLRLFVDTAGVPRRIAVQNPLGYGLDERAVEAVTKWRFVPGMRAGKPVVTEVIVGIDFEYAATPRF